LSLTPIIAAAGYGALICIKLGQVHRKNVRSRKRPVLSESGETASKPSAGPSATAEQGGTEPPAIPAQIARLGLVLTKVNATGGRGRLSCSISGELRSPCKVEKSRRHS
jgi:hypothetical protein